MGLEGFHLAMTGLAAYMRPAPAFKLVRHDRSGCVADVAPSAADLAMERYARGDDAAFAELYDLLAPRLIGYLTRQTRDTARAEDLVQQTLLRIHRARGRFLPGAAVFPWAVAIARRLLIDDLRRRRGDGGVRSLDDEPHLEPPDPAPTAVELVAAGELLARIRLELAKLPESQREAFELIKEDGLSLAEAAAVLGTTVTAVKLRAHRAYLALRKALGDLAPDLPPEGEVPS
jgi:RNA polymerase sigma-70 factor (ECF subfamily)